MLSEHSRLHLSHANVLDPTDLSPLSDQVPTLTHVAISASELDGYGKIVLSGEAQVQKEKTICSPSCADCDLQCICV